MKHTIFGLQQKTVCELEMGLAECLIYRYILDFLPHMKSIQVDDELYYWVDYTYLNKNLPVLNVRKKSTTDRKVKERVSRPIDNLAEAGVVKKYVKRVAAGTYIYIALDKAIHQRLTGLKAPEPASLQHYRKTGDACTTEKPGMHIKDDSSIKDSSINLSNDLNSAKKTETEKRPEEKTDGQTDNQNDLIQSYVIAYSCPRDFVLQQIDRLKAERQRRLDKGIEKITNEKRYLAKMLSDEDSLALFHVENEVKEKKKPTVRGFKTQEENALKEKEDDEKKIDRLTEDENRRNDSEFHEMLKQPDCELYKKCFDSLVDYAKQVVVKGENPMLIEISMYSAYKKMTGGFKQTG